MPGKKRKKPTQSGPATRKTSKTDRANNPSDSLYDPSPGYRAFLNRYIVGAGFGSEKAKKALAPSMVRDWQDVPQDDSGEIVNEIARKFNRTNILGIPKVSYKPKDENSFSAYGMPRSPDNEPGLGLVARNTKPDGPNPTTVGHELVHANDHQSALSDDHLTPLVWGNLARLVSTGGAGGAGAPTPMADFAELNASLGKIQDKIDHIKDFKKFYPLTQDGIEFHFNIIDADNEVNKAIATHGAESAEADKAKEYRKELLTRKKTGLYKIPKVGKGKAASPDWPQLFQQIDSKVSLPPGSPAGEIPNKGFLLNQVSEYPAFMSESLTRRWRANEGLNPLSHPEARFVHSTLGNMENSYNAAEHPVMNGYIKKRRQSLVDAYYPNGIPAGQVFSRGGRVTGKNLLSRFKKTY